MDGEIDEIDEIDEVEDDHDGYGPLPTDAASFATYLKKVADQDYCGSLTVEDATETDAGHSAKISGDNDIASDLVTDSDYLTERKGWFVSSVFGQGMVGDLHVVFQGTMRTMGSMVDVSDEMEITLWGGANPPDPAIVDACRRAHEERAARQWLDDIRYATRKLQNVEGHAIGQALNGQGQWILDTVAELNALLSRNVK